MKIGILDSYFYHQTAEIQGEDRIIFGGAERYLVELCHLFKALGHSVTVYQPLNQVVTDKKGERTKAPGRQVTKVYEGIPVVCLPDTDDDWQYSTNPRLNAMFNNIAVNLDLAIYFAPFLCYPYVVNRSISISHGIFWDFPNHALQSWTGSIQGEFFRRQLYGFTAPDVCVACDTNTRKVLAAMEPGAEKRVQVINNFVNTKQFIPGKKTWDETRVLYPRRLTTLRGCNEFIKAAKGYPDYSYFAVGQAGEQNLEKQAEAYGSRQNNLSFIHRAMKDMPEIYQQSDIAVVPTKGCEGLSLSLLEAMSCGLPVITTPVGGLGDAVINGYNALTFDPNHEDLGEYIDIMAKDKQMQEVFGKRNREIAKCFDIKIWQQRWAQLLS